MHIAARICAEAGPGEVLVSRTVKELVIGSNIALTQHGTRQLRGVPGEWPLFLAAEDGVGSSRGPPRPEPTPLSDRVSLIMARKAPRVARTMIRAEQAAARALTRRRVAPRRGA